MLLPLFLILLFRPAKTDKNIVPVFLIDDKHIMNHISIDSNPFVKVSTSYFAEIIHETIKRSEMVVIFVEDQFSIEDLSTKDEFGTPYNYLRKSLLENKVKYIPAVIEPYKLLNQMFQPKPSNVFHLNNGAKLPNLDGHFKYLYVFFQDGRNESRSEILRRHDVIIREVYLYISRLHPRAVGFYTGKVNPVEIRRAEFIPISPIEVPKDPGVMIVTDGGLFRFVGVYAATQFRRALFKQVPAIAEETWTADSFTAKMAYTDFELDFQFSFKDKGWLLEDVVLLEGGEEVGRKPMGVGARWKTAYYCGEPLVIVNSRDGSTVTISEYQIQPLRKRRRSMNVIRDGGAVQTVDDEDQGDEGGGGADDSGGGGDDSSQGFGVTVHCGPYFSVPILSGLMVTSVFLGILAFGVIIMLDARSNNRLDDPSGKPLVIASELIGH